ncbi:hypothetical protein LMG22037_05476 [Paraburkholderia phenoliruptrix]|uniref:Uncharacterized protein n=1 Tax=Paraburkholderia phenoliruptrix TaxID=252970 RepID=A0A6J5C8S0_9BURK|nr:hypothetical protein [Paraburkholderia phenoliruptrix]CAB3729783.1 hypothetical protein LMG22037_05476 [Paraburkholderia phenoliruptrix]
MSDATKLVELLRTASVKGGMCDVAADLIEQQAALILSLESRTAQQARTIAAMCQQVADLERPVAPAVDAQPVGWAWKPRGGSLDFSDAQDRPSEVDLEYAKETGGEFVPLYASAQSEGLRKDAIRRESLEEAAKVCDEIAADCWSLYKGRAPYTGREAGRADPGVQGESDGADKCAAAIRALSQKTAQGETDG